MKRSLYSLWSLCLLLSLSLFASCLQPTFAASDFDGEKPFGPQDGEFPSVFLLNMNDTNFKTQLDTLKKEPNVSYVAVEFMAPWCPHCRHFVPDMERLGFTFNLAEKGPVRAGKVDCVAHANLCSFFGIEGFPTIRYGPISSWLKYFSFKKDAKKKDMERVNELIPEIDTIKTAEAVFQWITTNLTSLNISHSYYLPPKESFQLAWGEQALLKTPSASSTFPLVKTSIPSVAAAAAGTSSTATTPSSTPTPSSPSTPPSTPTLPASSSSSSSPSSPATSGKPVVEHSGGLASHPNLWDVETAVAMLLYDALGSQLEDKDVIHLKSFIHLMCLAYPEPISSATRYGGKEGGSPCRKSMCHLENRLDNYLTLLKSMSEDVVGVGGNELSDVTPQTKWRNNLFKEWRLCDRNWDEYSRGWATCAGTYPYMRGLTCGIWNLMHSLAAHLQGDYAQSVGVIRDFMGSFFGCVDCREHFMSVTSNYNQIKTQRDGVLWVWRVHNHVNFRVWNIEKDTQDGDPAHVKSLFPAYKDCPQCYMPRNTGTAKRLTPSLVVTYPSNKFEKNKDSREGGVDGGTTWKWNYEAVYKYLTDVYGSPSDS